MYIDNSHVIIIVYSIENPSSFRSIPNIHDDTKNSNALKVLVGNKCDLDNERRVSWEEG